MFGGFTTTISEPESQANSRRTDLSFPIGNEAAVIDFVRQALLERERNATETMYETLLEQFAVVDSSSRTPTDLSAISRPSLVDVLRGLSGTASSLRPVHRDLLDVIFSLDLFESDPPGVAEAYFSFLLNIALVHPSLLQSVLRVFVRFFAPAVDPFSGSVLLAFSPAFENVLWSQLHHSISLLLERVPASAHTFLSLIIESFPHIREPVEVHSAFVQNILRLLVYAPTFRGPGLWKIFEVLVELDASIVIGNSKADVSEEESLIFSLDEGLSPNSGPSAVDHAPEFVEKCKKLDAIMSRLFVFVGQLVNDSGMSWEPESLVSVFFHIFDGVILRVGDQIRHTQFVVFHLTGLLPSVADAFLDHLVTLLISPSSSSFLPTVSQYLASFARHSRAVAPVAVARATFSLVDAVVNIFSRGRSSVEVQRRAEIICSALFALYAARQSDLRSDDIASAVVGLFSYPRSPLLNVSLGICERFGTAVSMNSRGSVILKPIVPIVADWVQSQRRGSKPLMMPSSTFSPVQAAEVEVNGSTPFSSFALEASGKHVEPLWQGHHCPQVAAVDVGSPLARTSPQMDLERSSGVSVPNNDEVDLFASKTALALASSLEGYMWKSPGEPESMGDDYERFMGTSQFDHQHEEPESPQSLTYFGRPWGRR